jgi:ribosomal protein S18 acetylase RimI-like enzyme
VRSEDDGALFELYAAVRAEELQLGDWDPGSRDRLLRTQFEAQRRGYREQFPGADERLILDGDLPIGWIIVDRSGRELHGIDIALRFEDRCKGVGTQVIRALQEEAAAENRPMVLSVHRFNLRARALYERLGFRMLKETDLHIVMEWRPE